MTNTTPQPQGFYGLGIAPRLLEILDQNKYATPTPIQEKSIPLAIEGKDLIGIAQTGTGKTLAFGIPTIQRLAQTKGRALIILPTRELALQVEETMQKIGRGIGLRTAVLIGGASMGLQLQMLKRNPHVVVATPGRLIDHLEQRTIRLDDVKILVLDEADRMLDMGFAPQIEKILKNVPRERQTLLFSATMPAEIVKIATTHMKLPVRVEIARAGTAAEKVTQEVFVVEKSAKTRLLDKILAEYHGSVLVFSRTKHGAKKIARSIRDMSHTASEIHSNRSLAQRKDALEGFKTGKYRVLVATDIAARGIDVKGIELVINYDLPDNAEDYVHRIGRTGRAGQAGHAISFASPDQKPDLRAIERLIRTTLPVSKVPELPPARPQKFETEPRPMGRSYGRPSHGGGRSFGGGYGRSQGRSEDRNRRPSPHGRPATNARPSYGSNASSGQSSNQGARPGNNFGNARRFDASSVQGPRRFGGGGHGGARRPSRPSR